MHREAKDVRQRLLVRGSAANKCGRVDRAPVSGSSKLRRDRRSVSISLWRRHVRVVAERRRRVRVAELRTLVCYRVPATREAGIGRRGELSKAEDRGILRDRALADRLCPFLGMAFLDALGPRLYELRKVIAALHPVESTGNAS